VPKKPNRAEEAVWIALKFNVLLLGITGLIFILFTKFIVGLFSTDLGVVAYGTRAL